MFGVFVMCVAMVYITVAISCGSCHKPELDNGEGVFPVYKPSPNTNIVVIYRTYRHMHDTRYTTVFHSLRDLLFICIYSQVSNEYVETVASFAPTNWQILIHRTFFFHTTCHVSSKIYNLSR